MTTVTALIFFGFPFVFGKYPAGIFQSIADINKQNLSWTATQNFPPEYTISQLRRLIITNVNPSILTKNIPTHPPLNSPTKIIVPDTFDARKHWPQCNEMIGIISNHGNCDKSWASVAASVMSDRYCIETHGKIKFTFSTQDIITCCDQCKRMEDVQCKGGWSYEVWNYWHDVGILSVGCKPDLTSYLCEKHCTNPNYTTSPKPDKLFGEHAYKMPKNILRIQIEIMIRGPVTAYMAISGDFFLYKEGVYYHTIKSGWEGIHNVKILGWGSENGMPYWLCANSWGTKWGNFGGFFKILRFENHCDIEANVVAGHTGITTVRGDFMIDNSRLGSGAKLSFDAYVFLLVFLIGCWLSIGIT